MKTARRAKTGYRGDYCLNCHVALEITDKYCHQCGQLNSTKKLALGDFFNEFFANTFSYDSKVWRTIKDLLFKPGFVSKQYVLGKRANYVNPFRFFFSVCIILILIAQLDIFFSNLNTVKKSSSVALNNGIVQVDLNNSSENKMNLDTIPEAEIRKLEESRFTKKAAQIMRAENEKKIAAYNAIVKENDSTNQLKSELTPRFSKEQLSYLEKIDTFNRLTLVLKDSAFLKKEIDFKSEHKITQNQIDKKGRWTSLYKQFQYYSDYATVNKEDTPEEALIKMQHKNNNFNNKVYERAKLLLDLNDNLNDVFATALLPKLPFFLFFFTPFIALFVWLAYGRSPLTYMEHMVFAFNVSSFVILSLLIITVITYLSFEWINLLPLFFTIIGPFYFYKSLRNFYNQGRIKTIIKFLFLNFVYIVSISIGLVFLFFLGIIFY